MRRVKRGDPIFMLVGNKCDTAYGREVSREEGVALARQFGCEFIEASAKTAENVKLLFMNLVRLLRQTHGIQPGTPAPIRKKKSKCVINNLSCRVTGIIAGHFSFQISLWQNFEPNNSFA